MTIEQIRKELVGGLESHYSKRSIYFIEMRLKEIAEENSLTLEQLNKYCWTNSTEMFDIIFDYKDFDANNFHCN